MMKEQNKKKSDLKVIFLRGGTGVGKTTIGELLSQELYPSVFIEQDKLRYMVVNGLVASRVKLSPGENQEEYRRQCKLADKNTISLTKNFVKAGFNVIIDGFNGGESGDTFYYMKNPDKIKWYPAKEFLQKELKNINFYQIILDTELSVLKERLKKIKKWDKAVIDFILMQRSYFLKSFSENEIDLVIKTEKDKPEIIVSNIINKINKI